MKSKWQKWLWRQKEGVFVGSVWGLVSVYAALGVGTLPAVALWHKFVIAPVVVAGWLLPSGVSGGVAVGVSVLVGALMGLVVDMLYKPKE